MNQKKYDKFDSSIERISSNIASHDRHRRKTQQMGDLPNLIIWMKYLLIA